MPDSASIRVAENSETIFREVLTSLEAERSSKSEKDILDNIQNHFNLPVQRNDWPRLLISKSVLVEDFLEIVLKELSPFVQMVLELYSFFSKTVSTTGGRTTHFEIRGGLNAALQFPDVGFPKRVQWIRSWADVQIESVAIDWSLIGDKLGIDNGIFYGRIREIRLIQSLIIARREQQLSHELRTQADRIYVVLRRAVRAWHAGQRARRLDQDLSPGRWIERLFVPGLHDFLNQGGLTETSSTEVGVDLGRVLAADPGTSGLEEVFCDPALDANVGDESARHDWDVQSALFFITLWGLDEPSFRRVGQFLRTHESSSTLLGSALQSQGLSLTADLIAVLEGAIVPTGESTTSVKQVTKKLEILLLPYWKDRWFLYEVWNLCLPMNEVLALNGSVDLLGIRTIDSADIEGTTWNLPTQKARRPVAKLAGSPDHEPVLVWFQRETRSVAERRNIEPDVRLTSNTEPYTDLMIIECKDRIKFGPKPAEDVGRTYLTGTAAEMVWIVNYEGRGKSKSRDVVIKEEKGRQIGIAYSVRPNSGDGAVRSSIKTFLGSKLGLWQAPNTKEQSEEYYLAIDVSGSMSGKTLPELPCFCESPITPTGAYLWCETVAPVNLTALKVGEPTPTLPGEGLENGRALARFILLKLPPKSKLIVVTDQGGKTAAESFLTPSADGKYSSVTGDYDERRVQFVIV